MFSKYDLHEAMNLRPGTLPFNKPITPAEMRVGLARAQYYNQIIRNVSVMAEREGWSGEDKYTALAFYTMLQLEIHQGREFRRVMLDTNGPRVMASSETTGG